MRRIVAYLIYLYRFPKYKKIHWSTRIVKPLKTTPKYIEFGKEVYVGPYSRIQGCTMGRPNVYRPHIIIEDNVSFQQSLYLTCANHIRIGKNTAIAANVTITDIHHPYDDVTLPIEKQEIKVGRVDIGEDCKIYNNVVILQNVTIGKHVSIGANSVVTRSIPDFCVVAGIPAHIIKRYDSNTKTWRKTDKQGLIIE